MERAGMLGKKTQLCTLELLMGQLWCSSVIFSSSVQIRFGSVKDYAVLQKTKWTIIKRLNCLNTFSKLGRRSHTGLCAGSRAERLWWGTVVPLPFPKSSKVPGVAKYYSIHMFSPKKTCPNSNGITQGLHAWERQLYKFNKTNKLQWNISKMLSSQKDFS